MSLADFCRKAKVSRNNLDNWESGRVFIPSKESLYRVRTYMATRDGIARARSRVPTSKDLAKLSDLELSDKTVKKVSSDLDKAMTERAAERLNSIKLIAGLPGDPLELLQIITSILPSK